MSALVTTLREIAAEQQDCADRCIHAPKAKAMYQARADQIAREIATLEAALAACRSIHFAVNNAGRHGGEFSLNDILAAHKLALEALGQGGAK